MHHHHGDHEHEEDGQDECEHADDWRGRDPTQVDVMSLAHIIDLSGQLLNKEEPDSDDETPFEEFQRYQQTDIVECEDPNQPPIEIEYVSTEDFPKIILATFISRPDVKRIDAGELISKLESEV